MASTTQLYNPRTRAWSPTLIKSLGLPPSLFSAITPSGTRLGPLKDSIARETGLSGLEVVASCSHDTGAAVVATPGEGSHWAYLSSGTWSLMGVERNSPLITDPCRRFNFTNEVGFGGRIRLLTNIIGLWLVQECRRFWLEQGAEHSYTNLTRLAEASAPFVSLINPADPRFVDPGNMPQTIARFCEQSHQPGPTGPGATVRCALESLALFYRKTLHSLQSVTGEPIDRLHVVGGGSRNHLLNQFTSDALQIPVVAGPAEATAAGNILAQAIAMGQLPSLELARTIVRKSLESVELKPGPGADWDRAYQRFERIVSNE